MKKIGLLLILSLCFITTVNAKDIQFSCSYSTNDNNKHVSVLCDIYSDYKHQCYMEVGGDTATQKSNKEKIQNWTKALGIKWQAGEYVKQENKCPDYLLVKAENTINGYELHAANQENLDEIKEALSGERYVAYLSSNEIAEEPDELDSDNYSQVCTYTPKNGLQFKHYITTMGLGDNEGVNYFTTGVANTCESTSKTCLASMGILEENGDMHCPPVYEGVDGTLVVSLEDIYTLKDDYGFEQVPFTKESNYPNNNFYGQEEIDDGSEKFSCVYLGSDGGTIKMERKEDGGKIYYTDLDGKEREFTGGWIDGQCQSFYYNHNTKKIEMATTSNSGTYDSYCANGLNNVLEAFSTDNSLNPLDCTDNPASDGSEASAICNDLQIRKTLRFVGYLLLIAKILIPILLIIFGAVDFTQAVISSKDNINASIKSFVNRIIAGGIVFLIPTIALFIVKIASGGNSFNNSFYYCTTCVLNPNGGDCYIK